MDKAADTQCSAKALTNLGTQEFDAIVIGAGVAGASAAIHLARQLGSGDRVLLLERSAWPRAKVCGCCLNGAAVALLQELQVSPDALREHGAPLARVQVRCGKRSATWKVPTGLAITRQILDDLLVRQATSHGVSFFANTFAKVVTIDPAGESLGLEPATRTHAVSLQRGSDNVVCRARTILVADGLGGSSLDGLPTFRSVIKPNAWIGLGASIQSDDSLEPGTINLNIAQHGYVGLVRLIDGTPHLAAAIDPRFVKQAGGPETALRTILQSCGVKLSAHHADHWDIKGTPMLTRSRPCVAAPGLLVLGDAASYVEPFTGEGIAWALASGRAAAELAARAILGRAGSSDIETSAAWNAWHRSTIKHRQRTSRLVRALVHRPALVGAALTLMGGRPWRAAAASAIAQRLSAPYPPAASRAHASIDGGAAA